MNYVLNLKKICLFVRDELCDIIISVSEIVSILFCVVISSPVLSDEIIADQIISPHNDESPKRPHVPIGVFIAEMPAPNKLVIAIAPNYSGSSGMLVGSTPISPQKVVLTTPWFFNPRYFDRVTPEYKNTVTQNGVIHYGLSEDLSIAITASYTHNYLASLTFKGTEGIIPLGKSYTETMGFSDLTYTAVIRVFEDPIHKVTLNLGAAYPIGSDTVNKNTLKSNGVFEDSRAAYSQQPSSQTYSFLPGLLYSGFIGPLSWGVAYRGRFYLFDNNQGWRPGNSNEFDGWLTYNITPEIEPTLRVVTTKWQHIQGYDPEINGKTPGADPNFNGGQRAEIYGGAIVDGRLLGMKSLIIATEIGVPFYQNLSGPQQMKNWQGALQLRYRY